MFLRGHCGLYSAISAVKFSCSRKSRKWRASVPSFPSRHVPLILKITCQAGPVRTARVYWYVNVRLSRYTLYASCL